MNKQFSWAVVTGAMLSALSAPAAAVVVMPISPAFEFDNGNTVGFDPRSYTLGFEFTLTSAVIVNALAYLDDALNNAHRVAIWSASGGAALASTTVLGGDMLVGHYRFHDIAELALAPGTYRIGGDYVGGDPVTIQLQGASQMAGLNWNGAYYASAAATGPLAFPSISGGGAYGTNGIALANFSVSSVPEPAVAALALLGAGFFGVIALLRRARAGGATRLAA